MEHEWNDFHVLTLFFCISCFLNLTIKMIWEWFRLYQRAFGWAWDYGKCKLILTSSTAAAVKDKGTIPVEPRAMCSLFHKSYG